MVTDFERSSVVGAEQLRTRSENASLHDTVVGETPVVLRDPTLDRDTIKTLYITKFNPMTEDFDLAKLIELEKLLRPVQMGIANWIVYGYTQEVKRHMELAGKAN
jgi:hypothetical protein